jgi:hypothetical protein
VNCSVHVFWIFRPKPVSWGERYSSGFLAFFWLSGLLLALWPSSGFLAFIWLSGLHLAFWPASGLCAF